MLSVERQETKGKERGVTRRGSYLRVEKHCLSNWLSHQAPSFVVTVVIVFFNQPKSMTRRISVSPTQTRLTSYPINQWFSMWVPGTPRGHLGSYRGPLLNDQQLGIKLTVMDLLLQEYIKYCLDHEMIILSYGVLNL